MLVYILMLNSINFGTECFSENILTQHFNHLEKLLVIRSFPSILQTNGFFRIDTADMINDPKEFLTQRPLQQIKSSHQLSTVGENPLDDSPDN